MDPGSVSECQTRKEPGNMNNSMLFGKTLQNFIISLFLQVFSFSYMKVTYLEGSLYLKIFYHTFILFILIHVLFIYLL